MEIDLPQSFSFEECLRVLGRSDLENLHRIKNDKVIKLIEIQGGIALIEVHSSGRNSLHIDCLNSNPSSKAKLEIKDYVRLWFDLTAPMEEFYLVAQTDSILKDLIKKYYGLRIIKALDLFEALSWAIIGQQVNLRFAYQIKSRLVEKCGQVIEYDSHKYYLFPKPAAVLELSESDLRQLQFSRQKIRYILELAEIMTSGCLNKGQLQNLNETEVKQRLLQITGIGDWSANYVMMRCFHFNDAFPIEDVGLHNALKRILNLEQKPTLEMVENYARSWGNWKGYATYYLWRSLLD